MSSITSLGGLLGPGNRQASSPPPEQENTAAQEETATKKSEPVQATETRPTRPARVEAAKGPTQAETVFAATASTLVTPPDDSAVRGEDFDAIDGARQAAAAARDSAQQQATVQTIATVGEAFSAASEAEPLGIEAAEPEAEKDGADLMAKQAEEAYAEAKEATEAPYNPMQRAA